MNILFAPTAREIAQWQNLVQDEARTHPLGIPVSISTDPRHHFSDNPATAMLAGAISYCRNTLEITKILITCNQSNIASRRVIESNGGVLENILDDECRYWLIDNAARKV